MCCSLNWAKVLHVEHIFTGYRGCQDLLPQISFVAIVNAYLSPIGDAFFFYSEPQNYKFFLVLRLPERNLPIRFRNNNYLLI